MRVDLKHPLTGPDGHKIAWLEFRRPQMDDLIAVGDAEDLEAARILASKLSGVPEQTIGGIDAEDVPALLHGLAEAQRPFADAMGATRGENGPQS